MEGNNKAIIRFKNRAASNISDKGVQEQYSDGGPFDVDLHTSDGKCVSAHRFVLVMFSKVWAIALRHAGIDGVISIPIDLPLHLAKKLVELLYFREVQVLQSEKETLLTAVRVYKIAGIEDEAKALAKELEKTMQNEQTTAARMPARRMVRSQSVWAESSPYQVKETVQRGPSPARNTMNTMGAFKVPAQVSMTKVRPANANNGGQMQMAPNRQPPPRQQPAQMVAPNRQPIQNQTVPMHSMNRPAQAPANKPNPALQKAPNVQGSPAQSKTAPRLPTCISISPVSRNNQQLQQQRPPQQQQQQQQQQKRAAQIQPNVAQSPKKPNTAKVVTPARAPTPKPNNPSGTSGLIGKMDSFPIEMIIDETIATAKANIASMLPPGNSVSVKPRNNQQMQQQQQQRSISQQQQPTARPVQVQQKIQNAQSSLHVQANTEKAVAPARAPTAKPNNPNGDLVDKMDDFPIDMDFDETIGNANVNIASMLQLGPSVSVKSRHNQPVQQQPTARPSQIQVLNVQEIPTGMQNGQNGATDVTDEIDDLPIEMDVDEAIDSNQTTDNDDVNMQELIIDGNESMSNSMNDTEQEHTAVDMAEEINADPVDGDNDEMHGFEGDEIQDDGLDDSDNFVDDNNNPKNHDEFDGMENDLGQLDTIKSQ